MAFFRIYLRLSRSDGERGEADVSVDQSLTWQKVAVESVAMEITGRQLRAERRRQKLTQAELSAATGVSVTTIGRIERGEVKDSPNATTLADHLGLTATDPPTEAESVEELLDDRKRVTDLALLNALGRRLSRAADTPVDAVTPAATGQYRAPVDEAPSADQDPPLSEPDARKA